MTNPTNPATCLACGHEHLDIAEGFRYSDTACGVGTCACPSRDRTIAALRDDVAKLRAENAALERYTAVLLDRLTNGRISKPMTDLVAVESEVEEAFTKELRAENERLQDRYDELDGRMTAQYPQLDSESRWVALLADAALGANLRRLLIGNYPPGCGLDGAYPNWAVVRWVNEDEIDRICDDNDYIDTALADEAMALEQGDESGP